MDETGRTPLIGSPAAGTEPHVADVEPVPGAAPLPPPGPVLTEVPPVVTWPRPSRSEWLALIAVWLAPLPLIVLISSGLPRGTGLLFASPLSLLPVVIAIVGLVVLYRVHTRHSLVRSRWGRVPRRYLWLTWAWVAALAVPSLVIGVEGVLAGQGFSGWRGNVVTGWQRTGLPVDRVTSIVWTAGIVVVIVCPIATIVLRIVDRRGSDRVMPQHAAMGDWVALTAVWIGPPLGFLVKMTMWGWMMLIFIFALPVTGALAAFGIVQFLSVFRTRSLVRTRLGWVPVRYRVLAWVWAVAAFLPGFLLQEFGGENLDDSEEDVEFVSSALGRLLGSEPNEWVVFTLVVVSLLAFAVIPFAIMIMKSFDAPKAPRRPAPRRPSLPAPGGAIASSWTSGAGPAPSGPLVSGSFVRMSGLDRAALACVWAGSAGAVVRANVRALPALLTLDRGGGEALLGALGVLVLVTGLAIWSFHHVLGSRSRVRAALGRVPSDIRVLAFVWAGAALPLGFATLTNPEPNVLDLVFASFNAGPEPEATSASLLVGMPYLVVAVVIVVCITLFVACPVLALVLGRRSSRESAETVVVGSPVGSWLPSRAGTPSAAGMPPPPPPPAAGMAPPPPPPPAESPPPGPSASPAE